MGLPEAEVITRSLPTTATQEWKVEERFKEYKNYQGKGGILPENIFTHTLDIFNKVLTSSKKGECHFITGEEQFRREENRHQIDQNDDGHLYFSIGDRIDALGLAKKTGFNVRGGESTREQINLEPVTDIELLYCVLQENKEEVFSKFSAESESGELTQEELRNCYSLEQYQELKRMKMKSLETGNPRYWSDDRIFAEALLMLGYYEEHAEFTSSFP